MKSLVITYAAELGRALLDLQRQQFERDKQYDGYKPEETFDGIVLPNEKGVDVTAYDKVVRLKTTTDKASDTCSGVSSAGCARPAPTARTGEHVQ